MPFRINKIEIYDGVLYRLGLYQPGKADREVTGTFVMNSLSLDSYAVRFNALSNIDPPFKYTIKIEDILDIEIVGVKPDVDLRSLPDHILAKLREIKAIKRPFADGPPPLPPATAPAGYPTVNQPPKKEVITGKSPDKKQTSGKPDIEIIMRQFPNALAALPWSALYGITKYEDPDGRNYLSDGPSAAPKYASAEMRHKLKYLSGEEYADDAHVHHIVSKAWNALAELELMLRGGLVPIDPAWKNNYMEDWKKQAEEIKRG